MALESLLLIIPLYNEAGRIDVEKFKSVFSTHNDCRFLMVNDGSTDNTVEIVKRICEGNYNAELLDLKQNVGKAEAIRTAVLKNSASEHRFIGFIDADLATPFEELFKIAEFAKNNPDFKFVMGSRIKKLGSKIERYWYRHYLGRVFATIVSKLILKEPVYDTQCGAKVIERNLAVRLFDRPFITRWLFDIELLLRFKKDEPLYYEQVYEYSLGQWIEMGESKLRFKDFIQFPFQLLKIKRAY